MSLLFVLGACAPAPLEAVNASAPPPPDVVSAHGGRFEAVGGRQLLAPTRLAVGDDGTVYVSDPEANAVFGYRQGRRVMQIAGLARPVGLAVQGDQLYVGSDGRDRVELYDLDQHAFVAAFSQPVGLPGDIAVAPDGEVLVTDGEARVVWRFGPDGSTRPALRRTPDGRLGFPAAVAVDGQRVVVADALSHRLELYDRDGGWVGAMGGPLVTDSLEVAALRGALLRPQALALDPSGLWVLDAVFGSVQRFDWRGASVGFVGQRGACASCVDLALDLALLPSGALLVTDPLRHRWVSILPELREVP